MRGLVRSLTAVAVIIGVFGVAQTSAGRQLLGSAGLGAHDTRYTVLRFVDPHALTTPLPASGGLVDASFVVRNLQRTQWIYHWSIVSEVDGRTVVIANGVLSLANGAESRVAASIPLRCAPTPIRVAVRLTDPGRSISFRAPCPSSTQESP